MFFYIAYCLQKRSRLIYFSSKNIAIERKEQWEWAERKKMSRIVGVIFKFFSLQGDRFAIACCLHFHRRQLHDATICNRCTRWQTRVTDLRILSHVIAHLCHEYKLLHRGTHFSALWAIWLSKNFNIHTNCKQARSTCSTSCLSRRHKWLRPAP